MSLHFIIDGYNLIRQTRVLDRIKLEDSRAALVRFLNVYKPQGSSNNHVTIVFDGKEVGFFSRAVSNIEIIFTRNESADEKIKKLVEKSKNPKNVVVVTNDREVQFAVRQLGARVKKVEDFLKKFIEPKGAKREARQIDDKIDLTPIDAAKITDELRKLWLDR